jgi:hypothetical protein
VVDFQENRRRIRKQVQAILKAGWAFSSDGSNGLYSIDSFQTERLAWVPVISPVITILKQILLPLMKGQGFKGFTRGWQPNNRPGRG